MPSVYARPPPSLARSATYATPASSTSRNVSSSSSSQPAGSDTDGGSTTDTFATSSSRLADASAASVTSDRTTDSEASGVEGGNDLSQLVYTSSATDRYFPRSELNSILVGSRKRNASADITGLLLYRDGSFAQFLEGPSEAVEATFERIEKDSRHRGVIVVLNRSVKRRDFPDWRMGYRDLDFDLKEENANEDEGQVGGVQVDELASGLFDLSQSSCKDLTHAQMSTSIRTLIRVFHQSLSRPI